MTGARPAEARLGRPPSSAAQAVLLQHARRQRWLQCPVDSCDLLRCSVDRHNVWLVTDLLSGIYTQEVLRASLWLFADKFSIV